MSDITGMIDSALYLLKLIIIVITYLIFVKLTKFRTKKLEKNEKRVPIEFFGVHIDLYAIFIPIYIILLITIF